MTTPLRLDKSKITAPQTANLDADTKLLESQTFYNHLECNYHLSNKKALFYNMKQFCEWKGENVFEYLPLTFHIQDGLSDPEYLKFEEHY